MEYKQETKNCQNCKQDFTIEPEDFNFYEKIKVPPPTFCPECRFQRRMVWRNERTLFKRKCDLCQKNIIAMYRESVPFPVYCRECWYGDGWDATSFGREYDFNKSAKRQTFQKKCRRRLHCAELGCRIKIAKIKLNKK